MTAMLYALLAAALTPSTLLAADINGAWTLRTRDGLNAVHLTLVRNADNSNSTTSADWQLGELQGLDLNPSGKHDVHFAVVRDAGRLDADGFVAGHDGAGLFRFTPSPSYAADMAALGFENVTEDKQLAFAIQDVSLTFARDMKAGHIDGLDTDKLLAFRIFGVDRAFIEALKAAGAGTTSADKLIAFRIQGVTPEFVKSVRALGFAPTNDQLVSMRIFKVTPEYIAELQSHGVKNLTVEQLISLRIHNIT